MKLVEGDYRSIMCYCSKRAKEEPFVFELSYVSVHEIFRELKRFEWESKHAGEAHFRNHYEGDVVVNVTAWNKCGPNEYFEAFLYYLKDREKKLRCFIVSEVGFSEKLVSRIERIFPDLEKVTVGEVESRKDRAVIGFSPESASAVIGAAARAAENG